MIYPPLLVSGGLGELVGPVMGSVTFAGPVLMMLTRMLPAVGLLWDFIVVIGCTK